PRSRATSTIRATSQRPCDLLLVISEWGNAVPADSLRPYLPPSEASHRQRPPPKIIDEPAECQEHLAAVAERIPQLRAQM
ncbi:hypothetical protein KZ301_26425, partial [Escherichia coli]|nr:hypothetical protein [Escherichia coli]